MTGPWKHSTGPKSEEGKARLSRNAFKGGTRAMLRGLARLLREQAAACLLQTAKSSQILIANFALASWST